MARPERVPASQKGFEGQVRPWHTPKKKEGRKEGRAR